MSSIDVEVDFDGLEKASGPAFDSRATEARSLRPPRRADDDTKLQKVSEKAGAKSARLTIKPSAMAADMARDTAGRELWRETAISAQL